MVSIICAVGETRVDPTVDINPSTPAPATRNKLTTPNLDSAQSGSSNFFWHLSTVRLSPDVAQTISASWRASTQSAFNTVRRWLDFCNRLQLNTYQPTVSQVLDFFNTLYELGLSYSAIGTHRSAISAMLGRDPRSPPARGNIDSYQVLCKESSTWDFQNQGTPRHGMSTRYCLILSEKFWTKWLT